MRKARTKDGKKGRWGKFTSAMPTPKPDGPLFVLTKISTKLHVAIFQKTKGRVMGTFDAAPLLVLHHRGAKSGQPRQTPVIYLEDGANLVIVASMGGQDKNPSWFHNLQRAPRRRGRDPRRAASGDGAAGDPGGGRRALAAALADVAGVRDLQDPHRPGVPGVLPGAALTVCEWSNGHRLA